MLGVIGLSLVVFLLFFLLGWDNYEGDYVAPTCTGLLLVWMYLMVVAAAGLTVWSVVKSAQSTKAIATSDMKSAPPSMNFVFRAL